jgi:SpoVK/Ycf46/Vps4 family AAA+-type ATPase
VLGAVRHDVPAFANTRELSGLLARHDVIVDASARDRRAAVIFIDELDAIGRRRG